VLPIETFFGEGGRDAANKALMLCFATVLSLMVNFIEQIKLNGDVSAVVRSHFQTQIDLNILNILKVFTYLQKLSRLI
jgi:hypothetical protein